MHPRAPMRELPEGDPVPQAEEVPAAPPPPAAAAPPRTVAAATRTVYQHILRGSKASNRGIRFRLLSPSELDELELRVAKLIASETDGDIDPETYPIQVQQIRRREGVRAMLVAVTRARVPEPKVPDPPKGKGARRAPVPEPDEPELREAHLWEPLDPGKLLTPGEWHFDALFTGGDYAFLKGLFAVHHEVSFESVDRILKKERAVTGG